jgi:glycosyltransferase involved in cell wall biosynthesis
MRLLFTHQKLDYAGSTSYALDLALALKRSGSEVRIATTGGALRQSFGAQGIETYLV